VGGSVKPFIHHKLAPGLAAPLPFAHHREGDHDMQSLTPGTPSRRIQYRLVAAACLALAPHTVLADPSPNAAAGQKLAQQYCAECHAVVPSSKSGWTDAPAFEAIANRPGTTAQALSLFIQQAHMHMLNTQRPPAEANEIAAYILGLRKS
jgi:mono/diheme cytochrome c family protein